MPRLLHTPTKSALDWDLLEFLQGHLSRNDSRARGLGTCWTTLHLSYECDCAEILGIPYEEIKQSALIPTGFYTGDTFKPAPRDDVSSLIRWDRW